MKARVEGLLGPAHGGAQVSTFHAYCLRLLRRHATRLGYSSDFLIYDQSDQQAVLRDCLQELAIDDETFPAGIPVAHQRRQESRPRSRWSRAGGDRRPQDLTAKVFARYQEKLRAASAMDFDDLIGRTLALFDRHPDVLHEVASCVRYLLVDEYQDTNPPQYRLIRQLSSVHGNVCAVGDPDQSIYRFRFADINNILSFESDFPGTRIIKLEQNYRSTGNILAAATAVVRTISAASTRRCGARRRRRGHRAHVASDDRSEADRVVQRARALSREAPRTGAGAIGLEGIAILYRTNAQSGCSRRRWRGTACRTS